MASRLNRAVTQIRCVVPTKSFTADLYRAFKGCPNFLVKSANASLTVLISAPARLPKRCASGLSAFPGKYSL